ncbi:MAG: hypothetical protein HN348_05330 [Proteobacteria bacterium]|nr:hypothetical protein [Pseudomonadota bacterium]
MFSLATRGRLSGALLVVAVAASIATGGSDDPITGVYVLKGITWPIDVAGDDEMHQNFTVSANADNFAFDPDYDAQVMARLDIETSIFSDEVPLILRLYRDGTAIDEVQLTMTDHDWQIEQDLIDSVAFEDCQVGYSCSFDYEVEVLNESEFDITVDIDVFVDLSELDGVTDNVEIEIDFD